MTNRDPMIRLERFEKRYGKVQAVRRFSDGGVAAAGDPRGLASAGVQYPTGG